ncbi:MAG: ATP-dependent DNA helicase RecG [Candidatus Levybacteria bacterium RIFCSPHIGHO2_02_FULL_37_13]|nr:MAG: ATP-dependent DNA helicase RecG [Candidatus Levybacteria bacterium RIFCSPHIGHO2_02_FULL_37_13]OGH40363.1 MAG: ATP-dependent DNA helicase RecG [Candidatus Levybacteria bacterium RIFCSPLOWO2_01_FULL_37_26]
MDLQTTILEAGGIYKKYASRLEKLNIKRLSDFLFHIPFRYDDYSLISKIGNVQRGEVVTIQGTVVEIKNELTKNWKRLQKAKVQDQTGSIDVIWFNQPYLVNVIRKGENISLSGKIDWYLHKIVLQSPEYEIGSSETIHTGRLVPVYSETRGVSSKWLRRQIYKILQDNKQKMLEYIPSSILKNNDLISLIEALEQIHFPKKLEYAEKARKRLAFNELFLIQLAALQKRFEWQNKLTSQPLEISRYKKQIEQFWENLPFDLTNAQKKAVSDIFRDLGSTRPMNRLLEGDVGSGKTVVSAIAMYLSFFNGFQSVFMAPTEILAQQHYNTINNLLSPFNVRVEIVTGSKKGRIMNQESNKFDILVGTHAVLGKKINFDKLGLVVIDEQQRFGVEQRAIIRQKGKNPHLLTMTATPIPRTIALTMYGDLDLSYLDEMPKGRKYIKTWLVNREKRNSAYEWIEKQINQTKSQAFIICPFIEESESMQTVRAATKEYGNLKKNIFPNLKLGMLHGKLKAKEKEKVLQDFRDKKTDILVATPVVEVGIDIPNATIMLIEASERFGLAQLHQLRGRVGRGDKQSYCLLFTESKSDQTIKRLKAMETTHVGAELAELDLRLRGPGEIYGTSQHGNKQLKVASFSDFALIEKTKKEAEKIFPRLRSYPLLLEKLNSITIKNISPD